MNHDFKYDFTTILDRRGKDALALDALGISDDLSPGAPKSGFDAIPMWVADMNFPAQPVRPRVGALGNRTGNGAVPEI